TCHIYRDCLAQNQFLSSLGEIGNCYDNALAERVNGILKLEYGLGERLLDFQHAQALTHQAVWLYNHDRPHLALAYRFPVEAHLDTLHKPIRS
ncbi:MAG: integrase core domain-containing protein, partial [Chloroflexota bacterium]